ncbi:universal stress protein [Nonomuraea soli]|uniref:Nucleotide-binding universal stress UspA family protein n=1 Tax=Nonomuraea soli TaxID=1032476 RepID=A0A7W0HNQ2_9ACTN|nr:universal stress protein [Nonomuraea soli]MBA2890033.1 nucleotide-binding universal stress UspA family protein [Nonomuraea soli]
MTRDFVLMYAGLEPATLGARGVVAMNPVILVGVDGSEPSTAAVGWAAEDARNRGLGVRLVHVCEQTEVYAQLCELALKAAKEEACRLAPGV